MHPALVLSSTTTYYNTFINASTTVYTIGQGHPETMQFIATVDECMELTSSEKEWPATTSHGHYKDLAWIQNPG